MRVLPCLLVLVGCHASATVEHTMPVANLQSYRTVALRVHSSAFASQGQAMFLESAVLDQLRQRCGFEQIEQAGQGRADVVLDLNVTHTQRGSGGFITNPNVAVIDTLLVLSDGQTGDLLGTASIHGTSSGMIVNDSSPEADAANAVAKAVVTLLATSGCSGPRVARAEPAPQPQPQPQPGTGSGSAVAAGSGAGSGSAAPPVDDARATQAAALDKQGKDRMYVADLDGALALFQQAVAVDPDPRYQFNVCLALGAKEQWVAATAACKKARTMNPNAELSTKIDHRLELLAQHQ